MRLCALSSRLVTLERSDHRDRRDCPSMPYVFGAEESVAFDDVDYIIEGDGNSSIPELANPEPTDIDHKVAALIAAEIEDGACLQIGIGGMPNTVCSLLRESGVRDLGIHSEMLVDGMIDLWEAGKITGARKSTNRYHMVFTFAAGSRRQYDFSTATCPPTAPRWTTPTCRTTSCGTTMLYHLPVIDV